ncbi:MAG: hypothetical protein PUF72_00915 [Clostridiales bacterium]|nr:hypothetical protein [Clostridiales bacterium]
MKNVKLGVWIFILAIIDTTVLNYARVMGAVPSLLFAFIVSAALLEDTFTASAVITMLCAAAAGALGGRSFAVVFILYSLCGIWVFNIRNKPRYTKNIIKALVHTALWGVISEAILYFTVLFNFNLREIIASAVYPALYDMIAVLIIYPLLEASVYKNSASKKLIV